MRAPPRRRSARSACCATQRERRARSAGSRARRRARSCARRVLRAAAGRELDGATRLCRCGPLLSNQSNRWDELQQVRLSAQLRTCTMLPQRLSPEGVSIRVRGNPARLSNTAGDAGITVHQGCALRCGEIREPRRASQLELLAFFQGPLHALAHGAHAVADAAVELGLAVLALEQLVRQVERGHHRDAVQAHHLAALADLAHAHVEELGGIEQRGTLLVRAGDHVLLLHDAHADARRLLLAHAPCSRVLRRPIMASTRVRTCSFLCMSVARSPARDAWRARSARFSSRRCSSIATSSSTRLASRVSSASSCVFVVSLMLRTIGPRCAGGNIMTPCTTPTP